MRIQVRTAGLLGRYLPPGSERNRGEVEVADGATPAAVIAALGMPTDATYLVSVNGEVVPSAERGSRTLAAGDQISIMPPLRGG